MSDRIIVGERAVYSRDCAKTGLNNNNLVCGFSGCGKTMSITEPRLLEADGTSMIVTLTKRRVVHQYTPLLERRGYRVYDLDFTNPASCRLRFDPMDYVSTDSDVAFLARAIVAGSGQEQSAFHDPYWEESAVSLLSALIAYVRRTRPYGGLIDVLELHDRLSLTGGKDGVETTLDGKFRELALREPDSFAVSCWKTFSATPRSTAGCIYSALNTTLDTLFSQEMREMLRAPESLDLEELLEHRSVLFVSTSSVQPGMQKFISVFYSMIFKSLFEYADLQPDGRLPIPLELVCDDFASGGRIVNFPDLISVLRERNMSVTLLLQSETQLASMYGANQAATIINNCNTYVYMGGMDLKTAMNISTRANLPLEDVLALPVGAEIVCRIGHRPLKTKRYPILESPIYQETLEDYSIYLQKDHSPVSKRNEQAAPAIDFMTFAALSRSEPYLIDQEEEILHRLEEAGIDACGSMPFI